jgi:hypothetical protein
MYKHRKNRVCCLERNLVGTRNGNVEHILYKQAKLSLGGVYQIRVKVSLTGCPSETGLSY